MEKSYPVEIWKTVHFEFEFSNDYKLEVSNLGRLRSYNRINKGKILKGSIVSGYPII